jgi:hypothetical protein
MRYGSEGVMANIDYSADFCSALDGLSEAAEYALKKFREQPAEARSVQAQNEVGAKLRQINRLVGNMQAIVFPEMGAVTCTVCGQSMRTEKAYWSGVCFTCQGRTSG